MKRRNYIQSSFAAIAGLGVGVGSVTAERPDELDGFYRKVKQKYGREEARISTQIVADHNRQRQKGVMTEAEAFEATTSAILDHPEIEKGAEDLRQFFENKQNIGSPDPNSDGDVSTSGGELDGGSGGNGLVLDQAYIEKDTAYNAEAHVSVDTSADIVRTFANASGYGGSYALGRLFGEFVPSKTGQYDITADYYRKGFCDQGSTVIAIYTRKKGYGVKDKVTEEVTSTRDGTVAYTKSFNLESGDTYEIGMQVKGEVSDHATAGSYADFYYDGREVDVNEMTYDYIG